MIDVIPQTAKFVVGVPAVAVHEEAEGKLMDCIFTFTQPEGPGFVSLKEIVNAGAITLPPVNEVIGEIDPEVAA